MKTFQIGILCAIFVTAYAFPFKITTTKNDINDGKLNMTQIITKYGFPAESHEIQTPDGYILTVFRIPYGLHCRNQTKKLPVILQHGLLSSSYDFITNGPYNSLSFILARNCHDVWIGNSRGNEFGRKHITLTPSNPKFWDFSWHEMGYYDVPATINYVLETSNQKYLHYIGYSQGSTTAFVFGALHPEYHSKIRSLHTMSPVAFMKHIKDPMAKFLSIFAKPLDVLVNLVGLYDLQPTLELYKLLGSKLCSEKYPHLQDLCANIIFLIHGFDEPQLNKTAMSTYLAHTPSGAAVKQLVHYAQLIQSGKFRQFDYGVYKNLEVYKSIFPPNYNISAINIPTALYYARNDKIASPKNAKEVKARLPNVVEAYEVPYSKFTHVDFAIAIDAKILVYDKIIEVINRYE